MKGASALPALTSPHAASERLANLRKGRRTLEGKGGFAWADYRRRAEKQLAHRQPRELRADQPRRKPSEVILYGGLTGASWVNRSSESKPTAVTGPAPSLIGLDLETSQMVVLQANFRVIRHLGTPFFDHAALANQLPQNYQQTLLRQFQRQCHPPQGILPKRNATSLQKDACVFPTAGGFEPLKQQREPP